MSDARVKRQHREAMLRAMRRYARLGHDILKSDGNPFDFIATRKNESRHVRVTIGEPTRKDEEAICGPKLPSTCTRELYYETETGYELKEVRE